MEICTLMLPQHNPNVGYVKLFLLNPILLHIRRVYTFLNEVILLVL